MAASSSATILPELRSRRERPVATEESLLDDAPSNIKRSIAPAGPAKHLTDAPLLVEEFAAERARERPRANEQKGMNAMPLADDEAKRMEIQKMTGKERKRAAQ